MDDRSYFRLQFIVFALVSSSFTNIYITQPVLPVLQNEFSADMVQVSFTVSAVILGIAVSNLPFGFLIDKISIHPIILTGGIMVAGCGLVCMTTNDLWVLIGARFVQGLFIPSLTTCLAAYLAKTLPAARLNVVMGSYVSATVLGGLCGRMLGGWLHPPLHWRYAFLSASIITLLATISGVRGLPKTRQTNRFRPQATGFLSLLIRWDLLRIYLCAMGGFALFSSVFNYLPYRLAAPPFDFSTEKTTLLYLVYLAGVFTGPVAGKLSNRFGSGKTLLTGTGMLGTALVLLLVPSVLAVILGLLVMCTAFFTIHAAAVGSLNRRLSSGQGLANALYVLFYYLGGWLGITGMGLVYEAWGWNSLIYAALVLLLIPLTTGLAEQRTSP